MKQKALLVLCALLLWAGCKGDRDEPPMGGSTGPEAEQGAEPSSTEPPILPVIAEPEPEPEPPKPPADPVLTELAQMSQSVANYGPLDCARLSRHRVLDWEQCDAFQRVIDKGRTSGARSQMLSAMERHGYVQLRGQVVALVDQGTYEVTAQRKHAPHRRALLVTRSFGYTTTGGYRLWTRKIGSQMITTVRGDYQQWPTYEENNVGRIYKAMRAAPAGHETSSAARTLVAELIASVALDRLGENR